jgi:5'-nucleotidase, C-terminal domain
MIEGVFLFADETRVVTFPISGARLRDLLEVSVGRGGLGNGPYLQLSGVRFRFDASLPSGARVVGDLTHDDGRPIGAADMLQLSIVSYPPCRSGDGYRIPEAAAACQSLEANPGSRPRTADLVLQHLERMNGRIVPPPTGRVTRLDRR